MLAGTAPVDGSVAGQLAADLRPALAERNPAKALLSFYVRKGQYPGIEDYLGTPVYVHETDSQDNNLHSGYLSGDFAIRAVQATPGNVGDLIEQPPAAVASTGLLSWRNYIGAVAMPAVLLLVFLTLALLAEGPYRITAGIRRRRQERAHVLSMLPQAREVYALQQKLAAYPQDNPQVAAARKLAADTFKQVNETVPGVEATAAIATAVESIESQLREIEESSQAYVDAYTSLHE